MKAHNRDYSRASTDERRRCRWAPGVVAFETTDGKLQVRDRGCDHGVELEDPERRGTLLLLREALGRSAVIDDLAMHLPEPSWVAVREALDELVSRGYVTVDEPELSETAVSSPAMYLSILARPHAASIFEKVCAPVDGRLVLRIADSGIEESSSLDAHRIASVLRAWAAERSALNGPSILVAAFARDEVGTFQCVNRECAARGIPWIALRYGSGGCEAGPLVLPAETACFQCMALRVMAASENRDADREYARYLAADDASHAPVELHERSFQLSCALLLNEIEAYREDAADCRLINGAWFVSVKPLRIAHHRVLKVPGCPGCQRARYRLLNMK